MTKPNRLLTDEELYEIGRRFYKNFSIVEKLPELPEFLIAQDAKSLKAVGEWLDTHKAYEACVSPSTLPLPFLNPADYEGLYKALKRGELPEDLIR